MLRDNAALRWRIEYLEDQLQEREKQQKTTISDDTTSEYIILLRPWCFHVFHA